MIKMDQKKKCPQAKATIASLQQELSRLRSKLLKIEGERIEISVRHTDLLSHWNSVSATYVGAMRMRDDTIRRLLADSGVRPPDGATLEDDEKLRQAVLKTADKAVQTELW
uniref:Uncharacterized protein n=1 Tax=Culex tarsalis TaxID=7177 RepID=A0A1Q3FEC3_CULTA